MLEHKSTQDEIRQFVELAIQDRYVKWDDTMPYENLEDRPFPVRSINKFGSIMDWSQRYMIDLFNAKLPYRVTRYNADSGTGIWYSNGTTKNNDVINCAMATLEQMVRDFALVLDPTGPTEAAVRDKWQEMLIAEVKPKAESYERSEYLTKTRNIIAENLPAFLAMQLF